MEKLGKHPVFSSLSDCDFEEIPRVRGTGAQCHLAGVRLHRYRSTPS
jgi:hypothetical protein